MSACRVSTLPPTSTRSHEEGEILWHLCRTAECGLVERREVLGGVSPLRLHGLPTLARSSASYRRIRHLECGGGGEVEARGRVRVKAETAGEGAEKMVQLQGKLHVGMWGLRTDLYP